MAYQAHTQGKSHVFVNDLLVVAYFEDNAVQIDDGVQRLQRFALPLFDLISDPISHRVNQRFSDTDVLQFFYRCSDISCALAFGIKI